MSEGTRVMWMRGGTSKGGYFLAEDLPSVAEDRDALLLRIMGSPNFRQIDGMGGGDPLTSKVAVIKPSDRAGVDVDYLFLQVFVDQPIVTDAQNCGNILAGVGPFAIERGLVAAKNGETRVTVFMENTGQIAVATVQTSGGRVTYDGEAEIDGVPGGAAAIPIEFRDTAGSSCGALFPTGNVQDEINGIGATLIDNGMPCVVMRAEDLGIAGDEAPGELENNQTLTSRLEVIRRQAGPMMNLNDVTEKSVPKMTIISAPKMGGAIHTRTFIPHRCHNAIGVLGAVSVATSCLSPGAIGNDITVLPGGVRKPLSIEHPTGEMTVVVHVKDGQIVRAEVLRTARKLMDGYIF